MDNDVTYVTALIGNGVDFTDIVQNVTFDIGETTQDVLIPITRDRIAEPKEEFNLVLKHVPVGDTSITILEPSVCVGIILDTRKATLNVHMYLVFIITHLIVIPRWFAIVSQNL